MSVQNLSGQLLGQYELRELLGTGGMGAVYRGYQANLKRVVAVKVLPTALSDQPGYIERFTREAQTSAGLEHSHIVPVYDYGTQYDISYIVMRLLTGGSLSERMEQRASQNLPLPSYGEVSELLKQLASALDYAHSQGVIHRDIKPGNIMFDNTGSAFLVDFGIAKLSDALITSNLTGTGTTVGTPAYMPPEQWRGDPVTPAADQYALAVAIYNLITGRLPFEAPTPYALMHKHVNEPLTPPTAWRADVPEGASKTLERALAKSPTDRFPTITAFAQSFERGVQGSTGQMTGIFTFQLKKAPAPARAAIPTVTATPPSLVSPSVGSTPSPIAGAQAFTPPPAPPSSQPTAVPSKGGRSPLVWLIGLAAVILLGLIGFAALTTNRDNPEIKQTQVALYSSQTAFQQTQGVSAPGVATTVTGNVAAITATPPATIAASPTPVVLPPTPTDIVLASTATAISSPPTPLVADTAVPPTLQLPITATPLPTIPTWTPIPTIAPPTPLPPTPIPPTPIPATAIQPTSPFLPTQTSIAGGALFVGEQVYVHTSNGDSLNLRQTPGLVGQIVAYGYNSDFVKIVGGPISADGYLWWKIERQPSVHPYAVGWAVEAANGLQTLVLTPPPTDIPATLVPPTPLPIAQLPTAVPPTPVPPTVVPPTAIPTTSYPIATLGVAPTLKVIVIPPKLTLIAVVPSSPHALRFNGTGDYVSIPNKDNNFQFSSGLTVEAWVKPAANKGKNKGANGYSAIAQFANTEPPFKGASWALFVDEDGETWGLTACTSTCNDTRSSKKAALDSGKWQHLAATYDGIAVTIYLDGKLVSSAPLSGSIVDNNVLLLGMWEHAFNGQIDDVRVWNKALTGAQIAATMKTPLGGDEPGLVGYWRFDENGGKAVKDSSSKGNDGTLKSSVAGDAGPARVPSDAPVGQ